MLRPHRRCCPRKMNNDLSVTYISQNDLSPQSVTEQSDNSVISVSNSPGKECLDTDDDKLINIKEIHCNKTLKLIT